jgi:hypothetical protein
VRGPAVGRAAAHGPGRRGATVTPLATTRPQATLAPCTAMIASTSTSATPEDLGGRVGLPAKRVQGHGQQVAAVPQQPIGIEPGAAAVLLAVGYLLAAVGVSERTRGALLLGDFGSSVVLGSDGHPS